MRTFEKHRKRAPEGSTPDVLDMFASEVRFYSELRPLLGCGAEVLRGGGVAKRPAWSSRIWLDESRFFDKARITAGAR